MWQDWTGLPFVFAAWVAIKPLDTVFLEKFNTALAEGLDHIPELIKILPTVANFDLENYFQEGISYHFTKEKQVALNRYLNEIKDLETRL